MLEPQIYLRDGNAIYERSFAIIRAEADLSRFSLEEAEIAIRMIHACGMVEIADRIVFGGPLVASARNALARGAPILCDSEMVAHGISRARLPAQNAVICRLRDAAVSALAAKLGTTRSAAAVELWAEQLEGSVVAIGNAPTALFHLLELLGRGTPQPAAVVGHSGRLRWGGGIEAGSRRQSARRAVPYRARPHRWQCHDGGGHQRTRETRTVSEGGTLIGVGVGPGDPELLTLKAIRVLEGIEVIAPFCQGWQREQRTRDNCWPLSVPI